MGGPSPAPPAQSPVRTPGPSASPKCSRPAAFLGHGLEDAHELLGPQPRAPARGASTSLSGLVPVAGAEGSVAVVLTVTLWKPHGCRERDSRRKGRHGSHGRSSRPSRPQGPVVGSHFSFKPQPTTPPTEPGSERWDALEEAVLPGQGSLWGPPDGTRFRSLRPGAE